MHSLTIPANSLINLARECNPQEEILSWAEKKINYLLELGFNCENLIMDIGIGFNKTMAQSWYLLRNIDRFQTLPVEIMVGHSRKRFLNKITTKPYHERDFESAIIASNLLKQGVDYVRLHSYNYCEQICTILNNI